MSLSEFKNQLNEWGSKHIPFFFCVDFELEKPVALKLNDVHENEVLYSVNGISNSTLSTQELQPVILKKRPLSFSEYEIRFNKVLQHLEFGNSFLTNLTIKTEIETTRTLQELFLASDAKYKLLYKNQFLVFSPETFIRIDQGKIFSYPMKGTIDAAIPQAEEIILNNEKEKAEHITIVDLIRNDLSMVSENVHVSRFRYIDKLKTSNKDLLQVSSEVSATLQDTWCEQLGDILVALLPAGSISGAPKQKTMQIIAEAEKEKRGYYTGVFGCFDGQKLDSGVMIRFIEQANNKLYYRSGGGITTQSDARIEYQEAIDKIYVPVI